MALIKSVKTIRVKQYPNLIWVQLETDDGLIGLGESFRGASAIEVTIHDEMSSSLIGKDARHIQALSNHLSKPYLGFNASGVETRAASAIDIALWDLAGKRSGVPVFEALGGASRLGVDVYNTCAGYNFNSSAVGNKRRDIGKDDVASGAYDDQIAFMRDAGELAISLLDEGYKAMKIWPFDVFANKNRHRISREDLKSGLAPFEKVRKAVGDKIDVMCELHSLWGGQAAESICRGLEDFGVAWVEDPLHKMDDNYELSMLRSRVDVPICGSETLAGVSSYKDMLSAGAVDFVMVDVAWCGGLSEARKIAALAEAFNKPLAPHDCTGPVTLVAGMHLALHAPTAIYQEVVRASMATWYRDLIDGLPEVKHGMLHAGSEPGLGITLSKGLLQRDDLIVRESV